MSVSQVGIVRGKHANLHPVPRDARSCCDNPKEAVALEVVIIDWGEQQVERVHIEGATTERERNDCSVGTRDDEIAVVVGLRARDLGVNGLDVSFRGDNEGGSSVKEGEAELPSEVLSIDGHGESAPPETVRVGVLEGDKSAGIVLGLIKTSERDLSIVETVGKSGNLVRRDGLADQPFLGKNLNRVRETLGGEGGLG